MKVHFIAIGGAAMHSLALALHAKGYHITGSDDEINEPSRSRLLSAGLLPEQTGWYPEKIHSQLDAVILGMHARADNPELIRALQTGLPVYSYPEYLYQQSIEKKRIVIGGSHGKTTITAMILHVLKKLNYRFDYMAGSAVPGFDNMVALSDAPLIILEGDEYLSSPIDRRPKFHLYHPHTAVISGIAWDHINVFPTFENYVDQFRIFISKIEKGGKLIYCSADAVLCDLVNQAPSSVVKVPYSLPPYEITDGKTHILNDNGERIPVEVFGQHNLLNIEAARRVCADLAIGQNEFYHAISDFKGAARRLEKIYEGEGCTVFRDFAHSPSKLQATVKAVRQQFESRTIIACMELHTFSSLNEKFLTQYLNSMNEADTAVVYFNPETIAHKKLKALSVESVRHAFGRNDLLVFDNADQLSAFLFSLQYKNAVLLLMSSGAFNGLDIQELISKIRMQHAGAL